MADSDILKLGGKQISDLIGQIEQELHNTGASRKHNREEDRAARKQSRTSDRPGSSRGKKRDASGEIKQNIPNAETARGALGPSGEEEILRREILALGGSEEDLNLVMGIDNEDDEEQTSAKPHSKTQPKLGSNFAKELSSFVDSLGISTLEHASGQEDSDDAEVVETYGTTRAMDSAQPVNEQVMGDGAPPSHDVETTFGSLKTGKLKGLKIAPRPDWHATQLAEPNIVNKKGNPPPTQVIEQLHLRGKELLQLENQAYTTSYLGSSSTYDFMSSIMSSGTLSDKVSALTLIAQESPLHTIKTLESLLTLAKKHSRAQAVYALGSLKDLLGQGPVLPPSRRLCSFAKQPALLRAGNRVQRWQTGSPLPPGVTERHLILWTFEDWLKDYYFQILAILESWGNDEVEFARDRSLGYVFELLRDKPEQEANLLRLLVNKLGDPGKKTAAKASHYLLQLQISHPLMRTIIVSSIESEVLFRPRQNAHARYYCIITLNQIVLAKEEEALANQLLNIYFTLFVSLLTQTSGAVEEGDGVEQKSKRNSSTTKAKKARKELEELEEQNLEKLNSAILTGVNRAFPFSTQEDGMIERQINTLFKVTHSSNFNTSLQALMLMQRIVEAKASLESRYYRALYESLLDTRLLASSKQAMYLNLLYKSLIADTDVCRIKAFIKRLLQTSTLHQPSFICGAVFLVLQLQSNVSALRGLCDTVSVADEDEAEVFRDVPDEADEAPLETSTTESPQKVSYDPRKREPDHSHADRDSLWDLGPLLRHFHPSVSLFASRLLDGGVPPPKPDLALHTTIAFLDKFVYKNPKAVAISGGPVQRGVSIMQPYYNPSASSQIVTSTGSHSKAAAPLNSSAFLHKAEHTVKEDEAFFHSYFTKIRSDQNKKLKKRERRLQAKAAEEDLDLASDNGEADANADEHDEEEVWKAMVQSAPDLEGAELDSDDDDDELDLADLGDESEGGSKSDTSLTVGAEEIFGEDDDDLLSDDAELGGPLVKKPRDSQREEYELLGHVGATDGKKRGKGGRNAQRKRLKQLPTFASAEDYAEMLQADD